jgi:YD repeat-containing protein
MKHCPALWLGVLLAMLAASVSAQSAIDGYTHRIRTASSIAKLGPDLFGDATNMEDGSTTFNATDVAVPTNGTIPLSVGRAYRVDAQVADQQGRTTYFGNAVFGPYWDLDVPYMAGTFDAIRGWVGAEAQVGVYPQANWVKRCTLGGGGPANMAGIGQFSSITYQTQAFFSGININIPGSGLEEMLQLNSGTFSSQTIGGHTYYYQTKNNWLVGCVGSIQNAVSGTANSGEGFTVWLPDGRTYTFDWMVTRLSPNTMDDSCGQSASIFPSTGVDSEGTIDVCTSGIAIPRNQVFLYASKATDRFGNTVTYAYDPNIPEHLLSVSSSDGGLITLTYGSNGHVATISTGSRQWQYGYNANAQLSSVTQPDGSQWSFDYGQNTVGVTQYLSKQIWFDCLLNIGTETTDVAAGPDDSNVVTITHPSGATGVFTFRKILHGTRQTESQCHLVDIGGDGQLTIVPEIAGQISDYQTASLVQKTLTIPGALPLQWTYQYHPGWTAPYVSVTTVTDSAQTVRQYTYGSDSTLNYGELLQETVSAPSGLLRTVTYQYLNSAAGQNFTNTAGLTLFWNTGWEGGFHDLNRPLFQTAITQQGKTFTKTIDTGCPSAGVYCFDSFVRPTQITRSSQ